MKGLCWVLIADIAVMTLMMITDLIMDLKKRKK